MLNNYVFRCGIANLLIDTAAYIDKPKALQEHVTVIEWIANALEPSIADEFDFFLNRTVRAMLNNSEILHPSNLVSLQ